ncbi:MAG: hypothetical protein ACRER4_07045, partial [Steroidobacteraceae bacterium]
MKLRFMLPPENGERESTQILRSSGTYKTGPPTAPIRRVALTCQSAAPGLGWAIRDAASPDLKQVGKYQMRLQSDLRRNACIAVMAGMIAISAKASQETAGP